MHDLGTDCLELNNQLVDSWILPLSAVLVADSSLSMDEATWDFFPFPL